MRFYRDNRVKLLGCRSRNSLPVSFRTQDDACIVKQNRHFSFEKCRSSRLVLPTGEISNQLIEALKRVYELRDVLDTVEKSAKMGDN